MRTGEPKLALMMLPNRREVLPMRWRIVTSVRALFLLLGAVLLQACLQPANPYVVGPYPQSHTERQLDLRPMHTVCDAHGDCMACDPDNLNCRRTMINGVIASDTSSNRI